ncbi:glycosyltransferase family 2 protein [Flavobacterium sp.]|uniref:glycosyltransferase family 2 protein n=1 Tax=Flavobacterium sp. TaxID=239 RepID=UPI003750F45A
MNENPHISIVSPVYRAEKCINKLVEEIQLVMNKINVSYEIVLVDDRSPDNSWEAIKQISKNNLSVKSIRLSRNFGQHPAIMAGINNANGEWIVVMDCDLQDQPKEIEKLYNKALEGFDVVLARREKRKDSFLKRLSSKIFYKIFNYLSGIDANSEVANFGIYNRKVINAVSQVNDYVKFFPLFIKWVGYNTTSIVVEHDNRNDGKSSYSLSKLIALAFDTIISFSDKPLKIFTAIG